MATFMDELKVKGLDVNAPDSSRRLPLVEAVRSRDQRAVLALLEQGALAKSHEPASGVTPLHLAFQGNLLNIARALLAHGADPNAKDKSGAAARSVSSSKDVGELVALYDKNGPLAFESAPGEWLKEERKGATYFWSPATGESRWTPPRPAAPGSGSRYINSVTGQQLTSVPPALAWAKIRGADELELWLNFAVNVSSQSTPAELPAEMASELSRTVNARWYNPATRQYSYTDPAYSTAWRELKDEASEQPFFFNIETGESVWEAPEELAWTRVNDTDGASSYFFNQRSGEVSWQVPHSGPLSYVRASDSEL
ncbi:hypothetical protein PLESTM_001007800 [Pleodorina starrii]|nr:hypothetical protein PLESTM_001007800 [Pleodorina starrii]